MYAKITDFASKDYLLTGNPDKIIRGTEINDELEAIETEFTNGVVAKTGNTGSAKLPVGTQVQRDTSVFVGYTRFNTTANRLEVYDGTTWQTVGTILAAWSGVPFLFENDKNVNVDYEITTDRNAMSAGPITISSGITVTVPAGSTWTIV